MMNVYVVLQNDTPCCATLDENLAVAVYNDRVASGACRYAAVLSVPAVSEDHQVLMDHRVVQDGTP